MIYGVQIWGLTLPSYLKPLQVIQKRLVRVITFSHPQAHTETLLKELTVLKLTDVIEIQNLHFVYSWFHSLLPPIFNDYFQSTSSIHSYSTRQSTNDNLFLKRTNNMQKFGFINGVDNVNWPPYRDSKS